MPVNAYTTEIVQRSYVQQESLQAPDPRGWVKGEGPALSKHLARRKGDGQRFADRAVSYRSRFIPRISLGKGQSLLTLLILDPRS